MTRLDVQAALAAAKCPARPMFACAEVVAAAFPPDSVARTAYEEAHGRMALIARARAARKPLQAARAFARAIRARRAESAASGDAWGVADISGRQSVAMRAGGVWLALSPGGGLAVVRPGYIVAAWEAH